MDDVVIELTLPLDVIEVLDVMVRTRLFRDHSDAINFALRWQLLLDHFSCDNKEMG